MTVTHNIVIEVWNINLGRGYKPGELKANIERVLRKARSEWAILIFQEIDEADSANEHAVLWGLAHEDYARAGWRDAVPILVGRDRGLIVRRRISPAGAGLAKVTPHRVVSEALVRMIGRGTNNPLEGWPLFVFLGTHLALDREATKTRRARTRAVLKARAMWHAARGRVVVYALDTNTHGTFPTMIPGEVTIRRRGIDLIRLWLPKGMRVVTREELFVDLTIDSHEAIGVRVQIERQP